jgi:hypothetical protein
VPGCPPHCWTRDDVFRCVRRLSLSYRDIGHSSESSKEMDPVGSEQPFPGRTLHGGATAIDRGLELTHRVSIPQAGT